MSVLAHIDTLEKKHSNLEEEIRNAQLNRLSDTEVTRLKKEKLRIKDEIESALKHITANQNDPL